MYYPNQSINGALARQKGSFPSLIEVQMKFTEKIKILLTMLKRIEVSIILRKVIPGN